MKIRRHEKLTALTIALVFLCAGVANAQTYNSYSGGYNTGYGTVYGSFGQAMATQNLYNSMQNIMQRTMARNLMIKKWGLAAVEKAEREAKSGTSSSGAKTSGSSVSSDSKLVMPPPPVVRNHGVFRPDSTVDTGKAMADALGDTPEEKALIKQVCSATIALYEKEAAAKGWKNNIAGGLTFFTVVAMTIYRDAEEPSAEAANNYFKAVNGALDEMPEFATVSNKDKQSYNNMLISFAGMLLAGYSDGKQNNDASTIESYRKLAGMMIHMVLKTDPEKLRIEEGQIVIK
ncbi:MAG: hypothetical protein DMF63_03785 [Acidobacteria bacterium]|nr:MAG: hypothetical protein DMF63_03785 [Acidobacteriota bacterium]